MFKYWEQKYIVCGKYHSYKFIMCFSDFQLIFWALFVMILCLGRVFHELNRTGSTLLRINQKWRINTPKVWGFVSSQTQIKPPTDFLISKKRPNLQNSEIYFQNKFKIPKKSSENVGASCWCIQSHKFCTHFKFMRLFCISRPITYSLHAQLL